MRTHPRFGAARSAIDGRLVARCAGLALGIASAVGCAASRSALLPPLPAGALPAAPSGRAEVFVPGVPVPDPARTETATLAQLLAYADSYAPALRIARARSLRGEADVAGATPILQANPEITAALGGRTVGSSTSFEAGVSVQQSIEVGGERALRVEAAERSRDVAVATLDEARWQIHTRVNGLFFDALIARERVASAGQVERFAAELERIAVQRSGAGEDSPLTVLVARAEFAQARGQLVEAQREEEAARLRLCEVAGWPTDRPPALEGDLPSPRAVLGTGSLIRLATERHPSLRVRALAVAEADARVRLEDREAWPEPTLGFAYAREADGSAGADIWLFTVGVPIPLWNRKVMDGLAHGTPTVTSVYVA